MRFAAIGSLAPAAFFTARHLAGARLIPHELWGGVFSRDPAKSAAYGNAKGVKGYPDYQSMVSAAKAAGVDYGLVSTPNVDHAAAATAFINGNLPVLLEKPITFTLNEALALLALSQQKKVPVTTAYTYQNFWGASLAGLLGQSGRLGRVLTFVGTYSQEWQLENLGIDQEWRQLPGTSGSFNCAGDILTHIEQLVRWITGLPVSQVLGLVQSLGPIGRANGVPSPRLLDDDAQAMLKLGNGVWGMVKASQMMCGHANDCRVEVNFENGSIRWAAEDPEMLVVHLNHDGTKVYQRGRSYRNDVLVADLIAKIATSEVPPGGHNMGFHDALATMHYRTGLVVKDWKAGGCSTLPTNYYGVATLEDGVAGMRFLDALGRSITGGNVPVDVN